MSTISLAAQRSYTTGEAVRVSYRLPRLNHLFGAALLWALGACAFILAGLYAHLYWHERHPTSQPVKAEVVKPETQLSDMHYVWISKPFPPPAPASVHDRLTPMQALPPVTDDADWQQAPEGELPRARAETPPQRDARQDSAIPEEDAVKEGDESSLKALFMQALKEQQQDYSQGKIPAPPEDETSQQKNEEFTSQKNKSSPFKEKETKVGS
ncbi:hypothetical protein [Pseudenterobacter timonensis]|uniref:hypothetical protein n=1 Tax=Pseudenterobacter timonensis TaxID=1755099 RepID=UPI00077B6D30|nr:hypothetical protein [Pseudenterobacter timonensis]